MVLIKSNPTVAYKKLTYEAIKMHLGLVAIRLLFYLCTLVFCLAYH